MKYGYSTFTINDSELQKQMDVLKRYGCERIILDESKKFNDNHKNLKNLLLKLKQGDEIVVYEIDKLGLTINELLKLLANSLTQRGIHFRSILDAFDTKSTKGPSLFHIATSLLKIQSKLSDSEVVEVRKKKEEKKKPKEEEVKVEVTHEDLKAIASNGKCGPKFKLTAEQAVELARLFYREKKDPEEIAANYGVSKRTVYNYAGKHKAKFITPKTYTMDDVKQTVFMTAGKAGSVRGYDGNTIKTCENQLVLA